MISAFFHVEFPPIKLKNLQPHKIYPLPSHIEIHGPNNNLSQKNIGSSIIIFDC